MPLRDSDKTALISVYNKKDVEYFASELVNLGWKIISSGGTAKYLQSHGIEVQDVAEIVGGEAILGHRVVTLSREIHAGLLARDTEEDRAELKRLGIRWIGLVCVDMYPLKEEIAKPDSTPESVLEATDIGGPTMLRSAAKGRRLVISHPQSRKYVIEHLRKDPNLESPESKRVILSCAYHAEEMVAKYCNRSKQYLLDQLKNLAIGDSD
jgi:phosphoribosylaminoimidazolecarboxamide formyltransferase/IMP cyclohydrolase